MERPGTHTAHCKRRPAKTYRARERAGSPENPAGRTSGRCGGRGDHYRGRHGTLAPLLARHYGLQDLGEFAEAWQAVLVSLLGADVVDRLWSKALEVDEVVSSAEALALARKLLDILRETAEQDAKSQTAESEETSQDDQDDRDGQADQGDKKNEAGQGASGSSGAAQHLAGRFAAKEAFVKAFSGARPGYAPVIPEMDWREVEVVTDGWGRPLLRLHGDLAAAVAGALGPVELHVSLTHEPTMAAAVVVIEQKELSA